VCAPDGPVESAYAVYAEPPEHVVPFHVPDAHTGSDTVLFVYGALTVPRPSSPCRFQPQQRTAPGDATSAHVLCAPGEIEAYDVALALSGAIGPLISNVAETKTARRRASSFINCLRLHN
jgi:hypothetical protein